MAKRIEIITDSQWTRLYFTPHPDGNFAGFIDVVTITPDCPDGHKTHHKCYRGTDRRGNPEFYIIPKAEERHQIKLEDGSPARKSDGSLLFKQKMHGSVDYELKQRISRWLTPVLTKLFTDFPDGKLPIETENLQQ